MSQNVIFITGATGLLGSAIVSNLLLLDKTVQLILLIRGENEKICRKRLFFILKKQMDPDVLLASFHQIQIICGDISDSQWYQHPLLNLVTHVLHLAANTSFGIVPGMGATNIEGSISVAMAMKNKPYLKRYIHVGTAMICGKNPPKIVHEDFYPCENTKFLSRYTETKAQAERHILNLNLPFPIVIARPSILVGHSEKGCLITGSIFWAFRAVHALKKITWPMENRIDIISHDYAAQTLVYLLLKPNLKYNRYHISSGEEFSSSWHDIWQAFSNIEEKKEKRKYQTVPFHEIDEHMIFQTLGEGPIKHFRRALKKYYEYGNLNVVFSNCRLLEEGVLPPPKYTSYLDLCFKTSLFRSIYDQMHDNE